MKYDFKLDLESRNSLSVISNKINRNSKILEFGPASGRLTKYLKEELFCNVYIVEIDESSAEKASIYAEATLIGDIEEYKWLEKYKDIQFDFILFADVLEHLYNPKRVLNAAKTLLSDEGSIIISIPNIAHNSVVIDLLHNKFEYRKTGLLDDTHIRFFTYESICEMVKECNLVTFSEETICKKVGETEFGNYFNGLPNSVQKFLKNRDLSNVYQYIMELKKPAENITRQTNVTNIGTYYFSQLYINSDTGFNENESITTSFNSLGEYYFNLLNYSSIKALRFDPINTNCVVKIDSIYFEDINGVKHEIDKYTTNAEYVVDTKYIFLSNDPQIKINLDNEIANNIKGINIKLNIVDYEFDILPFLIDLLDSNKKFERLISEKNAELKRVMNINDQYQQHNENLQMEQKNSKEMITSLNSQVKNTEERIISLNSQVENNKEIITSLNSQVKNSEEMITSLNSQVKNSEEMITSLNSQVKNKEEIITSLNKQIKDYELKQNSNKKIIKNINEELKAYELELSIIKSSKAWGLLDKIKKFRR